MKSIHEASVAYGREHQGTVNIEDFETGANYVLDEIENVIKSDRILGHPFPSLEMRYNQIISVIEELKK